MRRALLDVNVLIALLEPEHVHHEAARTWLTSDEQSDWASCAITQNGFVRIVSQPHYSAPKSVADAVQRLGSACATHYHEYWSCDVSLLNGAVTVSSLLRSSSITDVYLLALAVEHDGRLVTFDRRIPMSAVPGATAEHLVVL